MVGELTMFKTNTPANQNDFKNLLIDSLNWESFEQQALWVLVFAHKNVKPESWGVVIPYLSEEIHFGRVIFELSLLTCLVCRGRDGDFELLLRAGRVQALPRALPAVSLRKGVEVDRRVDDVVLRQRGKAQERLRPNRHNSYAQSQENSGDRFRFFFSKLTVSIVEHASRGKEKAPIRWRQQERGAILRGHLEAPQSLPDDSRKQSKHGG